MKKQSQDLIAEAPCGSSKVEMTIGIDLGDVWSHYCTLNQEGEVVDRGRFRTTPAGVERWFTDLPPALIAMEAGTHSIWVSQQLQEMGDEVIVANNFSPPDANNNLDGANGAAVTTAGLITTTSTSSRQIQFALKMTW